MARVKLISCLFLYAFLLWFHNNSYARSKNKDLKLLLLYRKHIDKLLEMKACSEDYNLLENGNIFQDYTFWNDEIRTTNNVANYITSMWRYKDESNRSLIENEASMYNLAKIIALSSPQIFGSVICFDENEFLGRRQFCPYAYKNNTGKNRTIIRDLGRYNDYLTTRPPESKNNHSLSKHNFIWWHVGKRYLSNVTQLRQNTIQYDTNLDKSVVNVSRENGTSYVVRSNYIPVTYGKWTTPYYDCFGGQTWMITYLAPFYDENDKFL